MVGLLKRYQMGIMIAIVTLIALVLYWPTLTLPLIYDDLLHIRISKGLNLFTIWLPTNTFRFYRPLTFFPLILIENIFGYYPNWLLHGLNVAQHGINVILLATLSWRLWRCRARTVTVGLLFGLFPFSYQAIGMNHNPHPTTAGLILLALHTYLSALDSGEPQHSNVGIDNKALRPFLWWSTTGFIFMLSLLSHESAILFGPFAALVHWNHQGKLPDFQRRNSLNRLRQIPPWFIFLILGVIYTIGYQFLPIETGLQESGEIGGSLWLKSLYLLQAMGFPLTWFAHKLPNLGASFIVLSGFLITLGLTTWRARKSQDRLPLLIGWGWWGLASLVIAIPLSSSYLLHGPRLLYLSSIGIVLVWSILLIPNENAVFWGKVVGFFALGFVFLSSWQFVRGRLTQYTLLTSPIKEMVRVMSEEPNGQGVAIVNLPQWLAPPRNTFPVGAEIVAMLGDYLFADEIVVENIPGDHPVYPVVVPDLLSTTPYPYGIHDETVFRGDAAAVLPVHSDWAEKGSQLFIVHYAHDGLHTTHTGGFQKSVGNPNPVATFGPYQLMEASSELCEGIVDATLIWKQTEDSLVPTATIFAQWLDGDGQLIAQADGPPLGLRPDLIQLLPKWEMVDKRTVQLTELDQPVQLLVGAYDFVSGERYVAIDGHQKPLSDNAFTLPVTFCDP